MRKLSAILIAAMCVAIAGGEAYAAPAPKTATKQKSKTAAKKRTTKRAAATTNYEEEVCTSEAITNLIIVSDNSEQERRTMDDINYEGREDLNMQQAKESIITTAPQNQNTERVVNYGMVEVKPQFPGGENAMFSWISSNINYPPEAIDINGKVTVAFIIEKDGQISNVRIVRGKHPALDAEAVRLIKKMPKWTPGRNEGQPVRVEYMIPVTFKAQ